MNKIKKTWVIRLAWLCFITYMAVLIYFLFFSEGYGRTNEMEGYRYNLRPFAEITRFIRYRNVVGFRSFAVNIIGNVAAFVPFGFVLPLLTPDRKGFWHVLLTGFQFSILVELVQLISKVGICDVDDVILNTVGVAMGYMLFAICFRIYKACGIPSKKSIQTHGKGLNEEKRHHHGK